MMNVCDAEVERGEEDDFRRRQKAEEMKGNEEGAESKLFGCGALWSRVRERVEASRVETNSNVIAPTDPAAEAFMQATAPDPLPPS